MGKNGKKLVGLYEAARRLDVPVWWLKQQALANKIPCLRIGKRKLEFDVTTVKSAMFDLAKQPDADKPAKRKVLS
jgi:hypothetical protein